MGDRVVHYASRRPLCTVCRRRPTVSAQLGNCCYPCIRSYRLWLRSHDGTIDSAITWAKTRAPKRHATGKRLPVREIDR